MGDRRYRRQRDHQRFMRTRFSCGSDEITYPMMRVALITDAPFCKDVRAQRVYRVLKRRGYDVGVFDQGLDIDLTCTIIVNHEHFPSSIPTAGLRRSLWHVGNRLLPAGAYRARRAYRLDQLRQFKPDVIWCANPFDAGAVVDYLADHKAVVIYEGYEYWPEHLLSSEYRIGQVVAQQLIADEGKVIKAAFGLVTVSPALGRWYQEKYNSVKADIVYNAHIAEDISSDDAARKSEGAQNAGTSGQGEPLRLIHSGQVAANRNVDTAIDAVALVKDVQLTILGAGSDFEKLKTRTRRQGHTNIFFKDAVAHDRLTSTLSAYDAGLVLTDGTTNQTDGALPNKLFDYLAAGLAVIAVRTRALEAFDDIDSCALLIDDASRTSIASALMVLTAEPDTVARLRAGAARVRTHYTESPMETTIEEVFDKALAREGIKETNDSFEAGECVKDGQVDRGNQRFTEDEEADDPFVSVLVPAYNAQDTIVRTIESVLAQQSASFEVIVVDDGSTDKTAEIVKRYADIDVRVKLLTQSNQGTGAAIRTAADAARGTWLMMLGADDWVAEGALRRRIGFIIDNPGYDIYSCDYYYFYPGGHQVAAPDWGEVRSITLDELLVFPHIAGNSLFKRKVYDKVGGIRTQFFNEDYDLWLRMLVCGAKHIHQPEALTYYRIHAGQKTGDVIRLRTDDMAILTDLIESGVLSSSQQAIAGKAIDRYRRNNTMRGMLYRIIGRNTTETLIKKVKGS